MPFTRSSQLKKGDLVRVVKDTLEPKYDGQIIQVSRPYTGSQEFNFWAIVGYDRDGLPEEDCFMDSEVELVYSV